MVITAAHIIEAASYIFYSFTDDTMYINQQVLFMQMQEQHRHLLSPYGSPAPD